jgi:hypothetical protein
VQIPKKSLKDRNYSKNFPEPIPTKTETEMCMSLRDLNNVVLTQYVIFSNNLRDNSYNGDCWSVYFWD